MCKTSYVSKSSKLSLVKGFILDTSTQLRARVRARVREGKARKRRGACFSVALRLADAPEPGHQAPALGGEVVDGKAVVHFRELSVAEWHGLRGDCEKYATAWFARYGMPLCDLEDTIGDAAYDAYERVCRTPVVANLRTFMRVAAYKAVAEAMRKRKSRENMVRIDSIPLTMPDRDEANADDELTEEGFFASDGGAGAEEIVRLVDCSDCSIEPLWLRMFRRALGRQKGAAKKVVKALRKDSRPAVAAELSRMSRSWFYANLKKIQADFAQCFRAYRAWRALWR